MNGPGTILQHERLVKKLTIDRIHRETKIKVEYIEAIERDDVSAFPAEIYYKNFLKAYAKYLYLDSAEMLSIYEQVKIEKQQEYIRLNKKDSFSESVAKFFSEYKKIMIIGLICLVALFFVFIVAKVVYNINYALPIENICVENNIQNNVDLQQATSKDSSEQKQESQQEKTAEAQKEDSTKENVAKEAPVVSAVAENKSVAAEENKVVDNEITLQINAKQNTWIRLQSDNRISFKGVLRKGRHYTSKATNRFVLRVGNIENVEVYFNDNLADISKGADADKTNTLEFKRD